MAKRDVKAARAACLRCGRMGRAAVCLECRRILAKLQLPRKARPNA